jgi:hypothetical protein
MKTLMKWTVSDYHKMIASDILTGRYTFSKEN